jgi:transcriptional regulator with XRE-family HTH domain
MAIPNELKRRKELGRKLRNEREALGLSLKKACELVGRPDYDKKLQRVEKPAGSPTKNQRAEGATIDVLLLEDLSRLYGKPLTHFLSQQREKRLRTKGEILKAAAADGIRRTSKGKRTFTIVNGTHAAVGSRFDRMLARGEFVGTLENGVTIYKPKPKAPPSPKK